MSIARVKKLITQQQDNWCSECVAVKDFVELLLSTFVAQGPRRTTAQCEVIVDSMAEVRAWAQEFANAAKAGGPR